MARPDLADLSISEIRQAVVRRDVGAREVLDAALDRIRGHDAELHAFLAVFDESANRAACDLDARLRGHPDPGPLWGVPIALKDLFDVAHTPTTGGAAVYRDRQAQTDSAVVTRLRKAGAVLVGKTTMDELALGVTSDNTIGPPCRNPWDSLRIPGGSSGGSACAVAACECAGALGTDTGGSIRVPAALCGVSGLKPTFGRVSRRGVLPLSWSLDHVGPLARTAADVAILFRAIAGYDERDPFSERMPTLPRDARHPGVTGMRIGLATTGHFSTGDPCVLEHVRAAAEILESLGAHVGEVTINVTAPRGIITTEGAILHRDAWEAEPNVLLPRVRNMLKDAALRPVTSYATALRDAANVRRQFDDLFNVWDLVITPTTPRPALPISEDASDLASLMTRFTALLNIAGVPALSIPCGSAPDGLPVGLQIVGPRWRDERVLRAGEAFQGATNFHLASPPRVRVDT